MSTIIAGHVQLQEDVERARRALVDAGFDADRVSGASLPVPVTGPLGPIVGGLVGGHVGSLFSFSKMKEAGEHEKGGDENEIPPRLTGMLVAVAFDDTGLESRAVDIMRQLGVQRIERAQGNIIDGDWADFDPTCRPDVIA